MLDYKKTGLNILSILLICGLVVLSIYLGIYFWPFVIGILVAVLLERVVNYMVTKFKIPRKLIGTIFVILVYLILGVIISFIAITLVKEAIVLSEKLPTLLENSKIQYNAIYKSITEFMDSSPDTVTESLRSVGLNILSKIAAIVTNLVNSIINFIMFVPNLMIYIIITFLATLFLVTDRRTIARFMTDILPNTFVVKVGNIVGNCFKSLGGYLKAICTLIIITFIELLIAFTILKQPYPLLMALIISVVDALPILGTGTILIPWAIYSAVTGNLGFGIALLVVYLIITVVRQLLEPKIVSHNIGIHPFITLLCMYIGFKIFGLFGLIVGPVVLVILKNVFETMFEAGYLKHIFVYKKEKKVVKETAKQ